MNKSDKKLLDSKPDPKLRTEMNPFKNPDSEESSRRLIADLCQGGSLNNCIKRNIRNYVTGALAKDHGDEFAENNWWAICQLIINAHLAITYPDQFGKLLQPDQVKGIAEKYSLQLELLGNVTRLIDKGESEERIISLLHLHQ